MKKVTALLAACMMILGVFTACAKEDVEPEVQTEPSSSQSATVSQADDVETTSTDIAGMPNPMVETDAAGIMNELGFKFNDIASIEGVKDVHYFIIGGKLADMQFTYNGTKMDARMQAADELTDISGMYYTWTLEEDCEIAGRPGKTMVYFEEGAEENAQVCLWYDVVPGVTYSISAVAEDLDGFDITALAEKVYAPLQGEVDGEE